MGGGTSSKTSAKLKAKAKDLRDNAKVNRAIADDNWNRGNYAMAAQGYAAAARQDAEAAGYEAAAWAAEKAGD